MKSHSLLRLAASNVLTVIVFTVQAKGASIEKEISLPQETCLLFSKYVIGLKPYLDSGYGEIDACTKFWYCRVTGKDFITNNTKAKAPSTTPLVMAVQFSCANADPTKPYYDAAKGECVASSSHCKGDHNLDNQFTWTRPYNVEGEQLESCRAFGKQEKYFLQSFTHFDDPTKYWKCGSENKADHPTSVPVQCSQGLIWDSSTCICVPYLSEDNLYRIHQANIHPMNRYKCADPWEQNH